MDGCDACMPGADPMSIFRSKDTQHRSLNHLAQARTMSMPGQTSEKSRAPSQGDIKWQLMTSACHLLALPLEEWPIIIGSDFRENNLLVGPFPPRG